MISNNFNENDLSKTDLLCLISATAVLRQEKLYRKFLAYAKEKFIKPQKIYEALLQTYLFAGFPSALISLNIFSEYFQDEKLKYNTVRKENFKSLGEV